MGHLLVVQGDPVRGTDRHHVEGQGTNPAPPPPATVFYAGLGDYAYKGSVTEALSTFVTVAGTPVALVSSRSGLDPGEDEPGGGHVGPSGGDFAAGETTVAPLPLPNTLRITDAPLGTGRPNSAAGNALLTVAGVRVLLDGDPVDTCDGLGKPAGSKVTAAGQDFVTCSG